MQLERMQRAVRKLELAVVLVLGLALGTVAPVMAETLEATTAIACSTAEDTAPVESEWSPPPSPGLPGQPY
jgi:hypothetical protein